MVLRFKAKEASVGRREKIKVKMEALGNSHVSRLQRGAKGKMEPWGKGTPNESQMKKNFQGAGNKHGVQGWWVQEGGAQVWPLDSARVSPMRASQVGNGCKNLRKRENIAKTTNPDSHTFRVSYTREYRTIKQPKADYNQMSVFEG